MKCQSRYLALCKVKWFSALENRWIKLWFSKYCNYGNEFNDWVETNQTGTITVSVKVVPTVTTQSSNPTQHSRKPRPTPIGVSKSYNSLQISAHPLSQRSRSLERIKPGMCVWGGGWGRPSSLSLTWPIPLFTINNVNLPVRTLAFNKAQIPVERGGLCCSEH